MKKIILTLALLAGTIVSADTLERTWSFFDIYEVAPAWTGSEVDGDGAGWFTEIYNQTDGSGVAGNTTASLGWLTVLGGYTINPYTFLATEADSVALRLYNAATIGAATFYIDSGYVSLSDLDDVNPPSSGDLAVNFDFTGQSWQAVPEPATALLFGIGGLGAFIVRRNKLRAKEEADA